ncbi:MAG: (d)CMP kinase [Gammaproteobacteria bacterium]
MSQTSQSLPLVITIDGPGGTGKGTVSQLVAKQLGWHYLDSGMLYRVLAHIALEHQLDLSDETVLAELAAHLPVTFSMGDTYRILWHDQDITQAIRSELCGSTASKIAALSAVRQALLQCQRNFRQWPGLVTDGRDMGSVIFPDAKIKFFLHADPQERAKRRYKQLKARGEHVSLAAISQELLQRDTRDQGRGTAPLKPAVGAIEIDTTHLSVPQVFAEIMQTLNPIFCV